MSSKTNEIEIGSKVEKAKETVDYDDLISSAGEFGRYQLLLFIATLPFYAFGVFVYFSQMFITEVSPNHWCKIPELENLTDIQRRDLGIPKDETARFGYSQCKMYVANWTEVLATSQTPDPTWSTVPCQYGWEFNKTEIPYPTISSDLEWVCEKNSYQASAQSIFFFGSIIGGFIIGWVSDRFGRVPAAVISSLLGCIGGFASTFAQNFIQFAAARFVMGAAYDNCMIMAYLLVLEYIAPKYRTMIANLSFAIFYCFFVTALPWIALACGHWKTISLVTSLPLALAVFSPLILPESPRWLLSKGRIDEAVKKVLVIGRINRKEIPPKLIEQFKLSANNAKEEQSESCLEILKRPVIRKMFLLICFEYMCCTIVFDGLVRSIGQLDFDFFMSFSLVSFTEFPSMIIVAFIMDILGRRWLTIGVMFVSFIFCLLTVFASGIESVVFAVVARFAVNMSYSACMQWAAEILPTSVRGSGVSIVHICGYVATCLSPYIVYLKVYIYWLPLVVVGCIAGIGGLIALGLPETARKDMPHTFDDAEDLAKNQRLFTLPFLEMKKQKKGEVNESFESEL
ncbi:carcinine transporter-like [Helicoverpa zea]|uniref:carcinine transporter-like n=1 Tax=Helicoverpa zea TaxID=7113 RepID=UPI001F5638B1|nr:carcinine transporter-like [Helicoverpa zea]